MGKVITVWGSPGSGKSMFSCILAKALTRDKRKAIIINAEISVPMLPVWLPEQIIQANASVGQVLSSVEIDTTLVASHVTVLKSYPFIGLMGYSAGENPLSYPEVKYAMVLQLVNAAAKLVDFVILDCSSNMTNVFTPAAIESGDLVIRLLTPDLKGVNYLKAHQPLLVDGRFHYDQHMTFAGMARPFHALDEMGYIIGGFDGLLPYPAHAAQGQKGKHDLAHRIAKTGGCSPKGRNHSQEAENMADGLWISPRAVLQSKIRKWTA